MPNICQILGYFKSGNNQFAMKRTIMRNFTNEKYKFFLFIQNNMKYIYENNYFNNINNVRFFNDNNELEKMLKNFNIDYIILSIDFEYWFDCINNFNQSKIYYIGHGITHHYFNETVLTPIFKNWINTKINLLLCCKKQFEIISKYKKNVYKIGTLPQIENLIIPKIHNNKTNSILIIGGNSILCRISNYSNYINNAVLNTINNNYNNTPIFFKLPRGMNWSNQIKNNITILNNNQLIYNYFNCEIIIVIEGGTAYLEALLSNSKVILILWAINPNKLRINSNVNPFFYEELKGFYNFPMDKYPNLLVATDVVTLNNHLNIIKNNSEYFNSEEYLKDKNNFIKDSIGEYIPNISQQLIDIIEHV